jgi:hypothetical protein
VVTIRATSHGYSTGAIARISPSTSSRVFFLRFWPASPSLGVVTRQHPAAEYAIERRDVRRDVHAVVNRSPKAKFPVLLGRVQLLEVQLPEQFPYPAEVVRYLGLFLFKPVVAIKVFAEDAGPPRAPLTYGNLTRVREPFCALSLREALRYSTGAEEHSLGYSQRTL